MGISSAIASISKEGKVRKALRIQVAALLCIFLNFLRGYDKSALL